MEQWGEKTCLNIPLSFKGEVLGLLIFVEMDRERTFDDHDLHLAKAIGKQATVALQNVRLYRELRRRSDKDELTGLANARRLRESLVAEVARHLRHRQPVSLIALEIDDARKAVDELGREGSNELLRTVASALAGPLHEHIDVIARTSGGRFVVVTPFASLHGDEPEGKGKKAGDGLTPHEGGAAGLAERLRQAVEQLTTDLHGKPLARRVTVCAGAASFGGEMRDADDLQRAAEKALRAAQRAARNSISCAE
jgi:GGDEF domain-containing protein